MSILAGTGHCVIESRAGTYISNEKLKEKMAYVLVANHRLLLRLFCSFLPFIKRLVELLAPLERYQRPVQAAA
jgi:hypothetical protein